MRHVPQLRPLRGTFEFVPSDETAQTPPRPQEAEEEEEEAEEAEDTEEEEAGVMG